LAPENPLVTALEPEIKNFKEVVLYIHKTRRKTEDERLENRVKTGVELKGVKAINPATKKEIPIWVADYVLATYGTGAIMAVPAHDERDFEFAKKHKLPIQEVVEPLFVNASGEDAAKKDMPFVERDVVVCIVRHWRENRYLCLKWKRIDWRGFVIGGVEGKENLIQAAKREIREETGYTKTKFIRELGGIVHAQFFHVLKNENRLAHFQGLYFELQGGERVGISEKEQAIHEVLWLTPQEVGQFLNAPDMRVLWERAQGIAGVYAGEGILVNSGRFSGMDSEKAKWEITKFVKGERAVTYKLHDWVFSRQRYWGEPIPIVYCPQCGYVPVPEKDLPVKLPNVKNYKPRSDGKSPLASIASWVKIKCPKCKGPAERETDVMPNWAGSSWYYLRYTDPHNNKEFASKKKLEYWLGIDPVRNSPPQGPSGARLRAGAISNGVNSQPVFKFFLRGKFLAVMRIRIAQVIPA
ncbi:MAG: NUDIX domain-containing protein, partial [Patescibacteria group bacterium]